MKKRRIVIITSAVALAIILVVLGYISSGLSDPKNMVSGNNLSAYSYVSSGKTYDSIESAMAELITFSHNETDYYLWIIYDLLTKSDAVDIVIG